MPVPFRDAEEVEGLGLAAYLKIEPDGSGYRGALLLLNVRGEPVEFTYTRLDVPHTFLWRQSDIRLHAARQITVSLFSLCSHIPKLIFCLAGEIDGEVFCHSISVPIPVCRVASSTAPVSHEHSEYSEEINSPEPKRLFWYPGCPAEDSNERKLFQRLLSSGLLAEPFERVATGLREVFK